MTKDQRIRDENPKMIAILVTLGVENLLSVLLRGDMVSLDLLTLTNNPPHAAQDVKR